MTYFLPGFTPHSWNGNDHRTDCHLGQTCVLPAFLLSAAARFSPPAPVLRAQAVGRSRGARFRDPLSPHGCPLPPLHTSAPYRAGRPLQLISPVLKHVKRSEGDREIAQSATRSPAAPALGSAGARPHPPGRVPDSAPPLGTFRRADAPRGPRAAGRFRRSACGARCDRPPPARPRPEARATGSVSCGVRSLRRRRRRPSPLSHLTHLSAHRRGASTGLAPRRLWPPARGNPGSSGSGGRSSPLPAEGTETGTRRRKALGPQPGGRRAAPGTRRTLPPAGAGTSFPSPLVRPEPRGGSLSRQ